ncbi:PREDICTED: uncharacterized protein LOC108563922 isoform X2 [Nicrophorus vespilloides]|nr:PREDICTED: uncharacterized protein LOC108563922 isoform X2 [Nicrophorus vespilloides]
MKNVLQKLNLLKDLVVATKKLKDIQCSSDAKACTVEAIGLSVVEKQRKQNNYQAKLKMCIKFYVNINKKLKEEIETWGRELDISKTNVESLKTSKDELKLMEAKVKRYENELHKYEKKYPWLRDSQHNLLNVMHEIDTLNSLQEQKKKLVEELNLFRGLRPDIQEASQQVIQIKKKYEQMKREINN